jgi:XTP/dITP diphosphohydrolase
MSRLLIATLNQGKLVEFKALLCDLNAELLTPKDLGIDLTVAEDGNTYAENAYRKASAFAAATGILTLADDSGLEVTALNGLPGIRSARFAPIPAASDSDRRKYLLSQLKDFEPPWQAKFVCVIAISNPEGDLNLFRGECQGEIIPAEKGHFGFGYDPIFFIPALGKTIAELTLEEKNQISHRARAIKAAVPLLLNLLSPVQGNM